MKTLTINTALMTSMMMIIGCGASKESAVNLEVSAGFTITSAGFTGGLLAHGVGPDGAKFSASAGTGTSMNTKIVDGLWKIFVIGYDGATAFSGTKYCGVLEKNLTSADSNISITINEANCTSAAFQADVGIYNVFTTSCGGFYTYNTDNDSYSTIASDDFCSNLPTNLKQSHSHYKIVAMNESADGKSAGLTSNCISTSSTTLERRSIPTNKFPFKVLTYPTLAECQSTVTPQVAEFNFPQGLSLGGIDFDHDLSITSANGRLVLPSSMTRRGRSPFMNMIPRILCGATASTLEDCFTAPGANLSHVYVPFNHHNGGDDKKLLLKGVRNNASIPAGFMGALSKFNISELEVDEGNVYGNVTRNCFFCQGTNEFSGIRDIYLKSEKIYILFSDGTNSWVKVYRPDGTELMKFVINGANYNHVAAAANGTLYLANSSSLKKFNFVSGAYSVTAAATRSGTSIQGIELNPTDSEIVVADYVSGNNYLSVYSTTDLTTAIGTNRLYSSPLKQFQLIGTDLYFYDGSGLKKTTFSTGGVPNATLLATTSPAWEAFAIIGTSVYSFVTTGYKVQKHDLSSLGGTASTTTSSLSYLNSGTSPKQIIILNGKVVLADQDHAQLQVFESTLTPAAQTLGGQCTDSVVATIGTTTETVTFTSKPDDSVYRLLETAFEAVGVRQIPLDKYVYAFREFEPHGLEVRSGGVLGQAQQMLGPDGIASFVSEFANCNALKTALNSAPNMTMTRSRTFPDILTGNLETYTGVFKKIAQDITNSFYCKDNTLTGSCVTGSDIYDIEVTFYGSSNGKAEMNKMKISCDRKVGSLESVEKENSDVRREFTIWNTGDWTKARFERYSVDEESETRVQLQKLLKTGNGSLWSRSVFTNENGSYTNGHVKEYQIYGGKAMTRAFNLSDSTTNFLASHPAVVVDGINYDDILTNSSFGADAIAPLACTPIGNLDMNTASDCTSLSFQSLTYMPMSDAPTLFVSINDAVGVSDPNHEIWTVFTLAEP